MSENLNVKPATFRLNEDDIDKFKEFATENNLNQQEAFASLLNTLELNKAKSILGSRANSINSFQATANTLVEFFINSLKENVVTEDRIRDELSKELKTKDEIIANSNEQLLKMKADKLEMEKIFKEKSSDLERAKDAILDWMDKNDTLKKDNADKQKTIDILNKNNTNQLEQLEQYKDLRSANDLLLSELDETKGKYLNLENENKQLHDKINNSDEMLSFYKNNNSELKADLEGYKEEIKDMGIKHNKNVDELKAEYQKALENEMVKSEQLKVEIKTSNEKHQEQLKEAQINSDNATKKEIESIKEQLNNKYVVSLQKKDLENEKLKNQIDKLKGEVKSTKNTSKTKDVKQV